MSRPRASEPLCRNTEVPFPIMLPKGVNTASRQHGANPDSRAIRPCFPAQPAGSNGDYTACPSEATLNDGRSWRAGSHLDTDCRFTFIILCAPLASLGSNSSKPPRLLFGSARKDTFRVIFERASLAIRLPTFRKGVELRYFACNYYCGFFSDPRGFRSDPRVESIQFFFVDFSTPKSF
jgi:hypothetical protein